MPNLFGIIKLEFVLKSELLIKYGRYETTSYIHFQLVGRVQYLVEIIHHLIFFPILEVV